MESVTSSWDQWVEEALSKLESLHLLRSLRPIHLPNGAVQAHDLQVFDQMRHWDRSTVEIEIADATFQKWLLDISSSGTLSLSLSQIYF